jgi:geranylgeranyl pyrophosphate synthase
MDELDFIKRSIKKMLTSKKGDTTAISSNGVLTMAAREFMSRKGKSFRPMLVLLIGRAASSDFMTDTRHSKLAVISEMIHTASLIHADVLEDHETDTSQARCQCALDVAALQTPNAFSTPA